MSEKSSEIDPALAIERSYLERFAVVHELTSRGDSPVQKFYEGSVVLVTGGSGFLGKQLIDKLFRSCKISKMYVLLRANEKSALERLHDILRDPIYEKLRKAQPDFMKRLIPVTCDISQVGLNIDEAAWNNIVNEVDVIFHGAATINFMEPLKVATMINVRGTIEMLRMAQQCKNLKSFVYISTAYSNATQSRVNQPVLEQFYEPPVAPDALIQLVQDLSDETLDLLQTHMLKDWPNTYAFTKAVAEESVRVMAKDLPICVIRPAIVMGAFREPPGWTTKSNINGPIGFLMGAGIGGLHVMYGDPEVRLDMVPVDIVNNVIIAAGKVTADRRAQGETDARIYTVSAEDPLKIGQFHNILDSEHTRRLAMPSMQWYPFCFIIRYKPFFMLLTWMLNYVPGFIADTVLRLLGKRPKAMRLLQKAYRMNIVYHYFMSNEWKFGHSNLKDLYQQLSPADQTIFSCDTAIDHLEYLLVGIIGVRKYIFKDGLQDTHIGVKKQKILRVFNVIYFTGYAYLLWKIFFFCVFLFQSFINFFFKY